MSVSVEYQSIYQNVDIYLKISVPSREEISSEFKRLIDNSSNSEGLDILQSKVLDFINKNISLESQCGRNN